MALINKSKIREVTSLAVSEEFSIELEKQVEELIGKAEQRARDNSRRTLLKRDL
jgi:hypothetical protein